MNKSKYIIGFLMIFLNLGNYNIMAQKMEDKYEDDKLVIALPALNILYIGFDNPVEVAVSGIENDKIDVKINNLNEIYNNITYIIMF